MRPRRAASIRVRRSPAEGGAPPGRHATGRRVECWHRRWRAPPGSRAGLESNSTAVRRSGFRQDRLPIAPECEPGLPGDVMPGLPDRPDLHQLRRQARELLRAAVSGDPAAVARIGAVSARMTLSAAQQALALEYGCRNWAALRAEVQRRRSPLERWSFGGAAAIETGAGTLLPEGLVAGVDDALLFTTVTPWDASPDDDVWSDGGSWSDHGSSWASPPAPSTTRSGRWSRQPGPMTSRSPMTREQRTPLVCGQRPALADRLPSRSGSGSIPSLGRASCGSSCGAGTGRRPACCARLARSYDSAGSRRSPHARLNDR